MKIRKGNRENAYLNGEWGKHVDKWWKRFTAHIRRQKGKKIIKEHLKDSD